MTNILRKIVFSNFVSNPIINLQQIRFYPRWNHRRPVRVLSPEEYDEMENSYENKKITKQNNNKIEEEYEKPQTLTQKETLNEQTLDSVYSSKIKWKHSESTEPILKKGKKNETVRFNIKTNASTIPLTVTSYNNKKSKKKTDMLETVIDSDGNFIYTKMSDNDPRVGLILTEVKSKKEKEKKDLILLEGKRLIKDALLSECQLKYIIFSRMKEIEYLKPFLPKFGLQLYKMPYHEMQMWSDLTTTPGIMGLFKTPNLEHFKTNNETIPLTLICENIREPGNLGAVLRICAGVGCREVILTKGCVNLWDTKVLRSSAGAHFKLKIRHNIEWNQLHEDILNDIKNPNIYIADNRLVSRTNDDVTNESTVSEDLESEEEQLKEILPNIPLLPYYAINFKLSANNILIVGGETYGISQNCYNLVSKLNGVRLNVPLSNDIESLNVGAALGIIAFEIKRQLTSKL